MCEPTKPGQYPPISQLPTNYDWAYCEMIDIPFDTLVPPPPEPYTIELIGCEREAGPFPSRPIPSRLDPELDFA